MRHLVYLALLCHACSGDPASEDLGPTSEPCVPSASQWDRVVQDLVGDHCADCHGATPTYGAPSSLTDYDTLVAGTPGQRPVDRMAARLHDLSMPPPTATRLPHAALDTLAEWASCGEVHPDHSRLLDASAPVMGAPEEPPSDAEAFTLRARDFPVPPDLLDHYQCFVFDAPIDTPRLAKRFEVVLDEDRVLHHVVLYRARTRTGPSEDHTCFSVGGDTDFLYAWAPGQDAFQFPEGGLRIEPGERYLLQVHYNNGAGIEGVRDRTGVRVWHSALGGLEYGMFAPGPLQFEIPPGDGFEVVGDCDVAEPVTILGGMPHMHEVGAAFRQEILRADGSTEPFIELSGWSFEAQLIYHTPATLQPGDTLRTTCTFNNPTAEVVRSGARTSDEMCFNFLYATPAPSAQFCDKIEAAPTEELEYVTGDCIDEAPLTDVPLAPGQVIGAAPDALAGGAVADGRYVLEAYALFLPQLDVGFGVVDPAASAASAMAQLLVRDGRVVMDMTSRVEVVFENGLSLPRDTKTSFAGTFAPAAEGSKAQVVPDCGADEAFAFEFEADGETLVLESTIEPFGAPLHPRMTYRRVGAP